MSVIPCSFFLGAFDVEGESVLKAGACPGCTSCFSDLSLGLVRLGCQSRAYQGEVSPCSLAVPQRRFQESSVSCILPILQLLADQGIYLFLVAPKFRFHLMQDLLQNNTTEQCVHNTEEAASPVLAHRAVYYPSLLIPLDK